jgi:hypothetical protein
MHAAVVFGEDVHALKEHSLDRVLPTPKRKRVVAQRTVIRVEHKRRATIGRTTGG